MLGTGSTLLLLIFPIITQTAKISMFGPHSSYNTPGRGESPQFNDGLAYGSVPPAAPGLTPSV